MTKACTNTTPQKQPAATVPGSAIAARIRAFYDELSNRAGVVSTAQEVEIAFQREYAVIAASAVRIPQLTKYGKLENLLAKALGWKSFLWQAANNGLTEAGSVRNLFLEKTKIATNLMELAAVYKALPDIQKLFSTLRQATPNVPLTQLQELLYDQIVIGQFPKLQNVMDSPLVRSQLEARYNQHNIRLQQLGLTPPQIAELDTLAGRISGYLDTLRVLAAKEGLDVPVIRNGGYFPIRITEDAQKFMEQESLLAVKSAQMFDTANILKKSRQTNVPLVFDLAATSKLMGMKESELANMLTTPGELSRLLREKLDDKQLDRAIDNGWLVQMPALSDEIAEFINESYDLPVQNLAEALILNPVDAIRGYAEDLSQAVKSSTLVKDILTNGIDDGWVLTKDQVDNLPNKRDFIMLGSNNSLQELIRSDNLRKEIGALYVHRTVGEQMESVIKLNQSWADLGLAARTWQAFTGAFRKMAIVGTGGLPYLERVFVQNTISLYHATGSLGQMGYGVADIFRLIKSKSFDSLDNTRVFAKVGDKDFTLQELFTAYFLKRGSNFVAGAQEVSEGFVSPAVSVNRLMTEFVPSLKRHIRMTHEYHKRFPNPFTGAELGAAGQLLAESAKAMVTTPYKVLAAANVQMDIAARWAAIRELASNGRREWKDINELISYTDEYFNIQEDAGDLGRAYGSVGQPFAAFAMNAPGSAIRHAIRKPWQAGRVALLYSQVADDRELSDAELAQWQKDSYSISLFADPDTGNRYAVFPTSVDFYLNTGVQARNFGESIARAFGQDLGTPKEIFEQEQDPTKPIFDSLNDFASNTYVFDIIQGLLERDPLTGEDISGQSSTLLGVPVKKGIRDALIASFPVFRTLDEGGILPVEITGQRRTTNVITQLTEEEGKPGIFGVIPDKSGAKAEKTREMVEANAVTFLAQKGFGLTLQEISPVKNIIANYKDFSRLDSGLAESINDTEDKIRTTDDQAQKTALVAQMQHMQSLRAWLRFQKFRVDKYAQEYGIPSVSVVEKIRSGFDIPSDPQLDMLLYLNTQQRK